MSEGENKPPEEPVVQPPPVGDSGLVRLSSAAIMEDVRNVGGRISAAVPKDPYRSSVFVPGQVETIDVNNPNRLDQQLGFPAHSVIIDNPTTQWFFLQSAQRFVPPGLQNAVWQIPKASTQAQGQWRAPVGVTQIALGSATQITLTFCEAFLMPSPGVITIGGLLAPGGATETVLVDDSGNEAVISAAGALAVNLVTLLFGEDATNNIIRTGPKAGFWKAASVPAVSTAPSASQAAAGAGVKNVLQGFLVNFTAIAAELIGTVYFTIRDGATGAGTILSQIPIGLAIGGTFVFGESGLYVPGTANTAFTIELTNQAGVVTAPAATDFASILMWGNTEQ